MPKVAPAPKTAAPAPKVGQTTLQIVPNMHVAPTEAKPEQPAAVKPEQPAEVKPEQPGQSTLTITPSPQAEQPQPVAPTAAPAPPADFVPLVPLPPRSMEELLDLLRKGQRISERLTAYKATGEKLSGFELAREGYTDRLTIKDGSGLEWSTSKSSIIQKVLDVLRADLSTAIESTEAELRQLMPTA